MQNYDKQLKIAKDNLEHYEILLMEDKKYQRIVDIAEYMIERIEFHKVQYDKYEDDETKNHINLLFKDIQSLFNNSRLN